MTKELRKAIMNRSKLRNKFLKTRKEESKRYLMAKEISVLKDVFLGETRL